MQETQFPAGELEPCARCAGISMAEIGNCKEPKATMHVSRIGAKPQERYTMQNEAVALLRCPICSGSFRQGGKSLFCEKGHCYDIARQGHVNFAPNAKQSFYKKELFESRAKVFEAGVFAPVVAAIGEALEKYVKAECPVVADAGCGEGYYLRSVCPERKMIRVGFDLAKEAVLLAAKGDKQATYCRRSGEYPTGGRLLRRGARCIHPRELRAVWAYPQDGRCAHQACAESGLSA